MLAWRKWLAVVPIPKFASRMRGGQGRERQIRSTGSVVIDTFAAMPFQSVVKAFDQSVPVEGLGQEARRARLNRSRADTLDRESRNKDERHAISLGLQVSLQFDAAHFSHLDICNDARRAIHIFRQQELFGRCECMDDVAKRPHEIAGRNANGSIIVNDGDHWNFGQSGLSCGRKRRASAPPSHKRVRRKP